MPIQRRPRRSAASRAVPQPQKASNTTLFRLLLALRIRSNKAKGFWVG